MGSRTYGGVVEKIDETEVDKLCPTEFEGLCRELSKVSASMGALAQSVQYGDTSIDDVSDEDCVRVFDAYDTLQKAFKGYTGGLELELFECGGDTEFDDGDGTSGYVWIIPNAYVKNPIWIKLKDEIQIKSASFTTTG